jgi:hypothetical protein
MGFTDFTLNDLFLMHLFQVSLFEKIAQFDVAMIQPPHFMAEIMAIVAG